MAYGERLLPSGVKVSLVGDCEFDHPLLIENLCVWGWDYALRQPGHRPLCRTDRSVSGCRRLSEVSVGALGAEVGAAEGQLQSGQDDQRHSAE